MGRYYLKSLTIGAGFRSFAETTTINFPRTGLVLIDGKNHDTGGSSASGKSTIVLAITDGFDYCPIPKSHLQSLFQEDSFINKYVLETDNGDVEWTRGAKHFLTCGGKTVSGSKAVSNKLKEILQIDSELLAPLTYREQRQHGLFLNMADATIKEFLTKLLGLEKFENDIEDSKKRVKDLELSLDKAVVSVDEKIVSRLNLKNMFATFVVEEDFKPQIEKSVNRIKDLSVEIEKCKAELDSVTNYSNTIAEYKTKIEDLLSQLHKLETLTPPSSDSPELDRLNKLLTECERRLLLEKKKEAERLSDHNSLLAEINNRLYQNRDIVLSESDIKNQIEELHNQIRMVESNRCFTCKQPWITQGQELNRLQDEVASKQNFLDTLPIIRQFIKEDEQRLQELTFTPSPQIEALDKVATTLRIQIVEERARLRSALETFEASKSAQKTELTSRILLEENRINNSYFQTVSKLQDRIEDLERDKKAELKTWEELKSRQATLAKQRASYLESLEKYDREIKAAEDNRDSIQTQLNTEKDWLDLIGREGFLSVIFDEILYDISEKTNQILATVPNVMRCSFSFRSETETAKGVVRKKIVPVVKLDGKTGPYKYILSGGQQAVLELAVDLAISRVIMNRTGSLPGWLLLDESFDGLGPVEKEACLEILKEYSKERLILVIDHSSEFKEAFQNSILVEFQNGVSQISSVT